MRTYRFVNPRLCYPILGCVVACSLGLRRAIACPAQQAREPIMVRPNPPQVPGDFSPPKDAKKTVIKPAFDSEQARADARQLAQMAQKVPGEVDQLSKNVLPKDLELQLKQIQKLAKKLRSEIGQ